MGRCQVLTELGQRDRVGLGGVDAVCCSQGRIRSGRGVVYSGVSRFHNRGCIDGNRQAVCRSPLPVFSACNGIRRNGRLVDSQARLHRLSSGFDTLHARVLRSLSDREVGEGLSIDGHIARCTVVLVLDPAFRRQIGIL